MSPKLFIVFLIIILISAWYFFIAPTFKKIDNLKTEIQSLEKQLSLNKAEIEKMKAQKKALQQLVEEKKQLDIALPREPKIEELMVEYDALITQKAGMGLAKISFTPLRVRLVQSKNKKAALRAAVKTVAIKMNIKGSYDAFKRFLTLLEKDLRLTDIQKINFNAKTKKEEGVSIYNFSISALTYYY